MSIDERTRHRLFLRLEDILGPEEATTLMEHLPPVGWADVATKRDLETLKAQLLAGFREEMNKQMRGFMIMSSGLAVGVGGLVLAAVRLS
jgi:hypothetical protein